MDEFSVALNDILVEAYYNILDFEEQAIKKDHRLKLSINEMHLIEAVGKKRKRADDRRDCRRSENYDAVGNHCSEQDYGKGLYRKNALSGRRACGAGKTDQRRTKLNATIGSITIGWLKN